MYDHINDVIEPVPDFTDPEDITPGPLSDFHRELSGRELKVQEKKMRSKLRAAMNHQVATHGGYRGFKRVATHEHQRVLTSTIEAPPTWAVVDPMTIAPK